MRRVLAVFLIAPLAGLFALVLYLTAISPSNDRVWDPAFSKLNTADFARGGILTIHNVRDFTYAPGAVLTREWKDVTVRPDEIESVSFYLDHFSPITLVGHTFVSFRFRDGSTLAFSIEARREEGETYTFLNGFLNAYDLQYLWGTERDLVSQRIVLKDEQLYRFPLAITNEQAAELIVEFAKETNALAETPRFYHTLAANCTNLLAKIVNKYHPDTFPYDVSWNLTGIADGYLERLGFIPTEGRTRDELRERYDLSIHRTDIAAHATSSEAAFSDFIRTLPEKEAR